MTNVESKRRSTVYSTFSLSRANEVSVCPPPLVLTVALHREGELLAHYCLLPCTLLTNKYNSKKGARGLISHSPTLTNAVTFQLGKLRRTLLPVDPA